MRLPRLSEPWRNMYRALVRQCSYLPDPIANGYMRGYIRSTFRRHGVKTVSTPLTPSKDALLQKRARKLLSLLQRANEGYIKPLERVLLLSYGRIGTRRLQLAQPLLEPDLPVDPLAKLPKPFSDTWNPPSKLMTLLTSQSKQHAVQSSRVRPKMKQFSPPIPAQNAWGRPTPRRRRVNIRRKWYGTLVDRVLPFLPEEDLNRLHGLASGRKPWALPKRRAPPKAAEDPRLLTAEFIVHGAKKDTTFADVCAGRPHNITRRTMSTLWNMLITLTPRITEDPKQGTTIHWGHKHALRSLNQKVASKHALSLFEGLDAKGKVTGRRSTRI